MLLLLSAFPVFGATITVTNTNDSGPGSLRDAIATAADGDAIDFSLAYPATITVGTPLAIESSVGKSLNISGPGASLLAISGGNAVSVLVVQPLGGLGGAMTVTISGWTIERGSSVVGGGIFNGGRLTVDNCTIAGNSLSDDATCADLFTEAGDMNSTPAGLDQAGLKNNGGPTETIAVLSTSPAVNAIPTSSCSDLNGFPIKTDQRGVPRPQGPACDIGAYEHFQSRFEQFAVQAYLLIDDVQSSPLPPGTKQGLTSPLRAAVASLNRGAVDPAINQLGAFINQTGALVRRGTLTSDQASAFTAPAEDIIQGLRSVPGGGTLQQ